MSKKGRPKSADLIAVRVQVEEAWAYDRHMEYLSYRAMRAAALADPRDGGLGYIISEHLLKVRDDGYVARMHDTLGDGRDTLIAREVASFDKRQRALEALLVRGVDLRATTILAAARGYGSAVELIRAEPGLAVPLEVATQVTLLREMGAVGAERRKMLGLDAPIAAKIDVTHRDAVADELAAMLDEVAQARPAPRKEESPR